MPPVPPSRFIVPDVETIDAPAAQTPQSAPPEPDNCRLPEVDEIVAPPESAIPWAAPPASVPVTVTFPEVVEMIEALYMSTP